MKTKIQEIQKYLQDHHYDAYLVFSSDDHGSEYIVDYYKVRAYLSSFTGSAGTLLITQTHAYLWTDGRYFLQAEEQLDARYIQLMRMNEENVPTIETFIKENALYKIAFDFKMATMAFINHLQQALPMVQFYHEENLINQVWPNRPPLPSSPAYFLSTRVSGKSRLEKIKEIRQSLQQNHLHCALIASLDDIAWLMNLRGSDILYNPVNLAYVLMIHDETILYMNPDKLSKQMKETLIKENITLKKYDEIYEDVAKIDETILVDANKTNYLLQNKILHYQTIRCFPTTYQKAIKNKTEIQNMKKAHLKDAIAMCKFMYYLKKNVGKIKMTECSLAHQLEKFRKEQPGFLDLSFSTICGYQQHGAIVHYSADEKSDIEVKKEGFLLVDSGAQYQFGTTDITRTFALGKITPTMKKHFTWVLKAHIALSRAVFLKGVRGVSLDMLAREPLFQHYLDYKHGTGHGVGYLLNVHEGPQNIRYGVFNHDAGTIFEEGMITSNEPGLYFANQYGIRHENLILCVEKRKNEYGTFLGFEPLTYVPFDRMGIDKKLLSKEELQWLNAYHKKVYQMVAKYLNPEERKFLKKVTRAME